MPKNKRKAGGGPDAEEQEDYVRQPQTKGWQDAQKRTEALPIKIKGRVFKTYRDTTQKKEESEEEEESGSEGEGEGEEGDDYESSGDEGPGRGKGRGEDGDQDDVEDGPLKYDEGESYLPKPTKEEAAREENKRIAAEPLIAADTPMSVVRSYLAFVCKSITAAPRPALKRRTLAESAAHRLDTSGESEANIADLFECMRSERRDVAELAVLSALLVFKDIAPDYRIKAADGNDHRLKKETKKQRDFERSLLHAYQQYLHLLERWVQEGLGRARNPVQRWHDKAAMGLSALRCECELIRALPHFNFRSSLLKSIVTRASQPCKIVADMCQASLRKMFEDDVGGELTFETVCLVAGSLKEINYKVDPSYIEVLHSMVLSTKAEMGARARKEIKRGRRKIRRMGDDVDANLAESDATNIERYRKKFQVDSLQELSLIYFRIIKRKVGASLIPAALTGLGKITHLVNLETIEDLLAVLKSMVDNASLTGDTHVRVLTILCALRTLAGPGQELDFDATIFVEAARNVLSDLPACFDDWPQLLECVQLSLLSRREVSKGTIETFVLLLLSHAVNEDEMRAATVVALTHQVLLRNPSLRLDLRMFRHANVLAAEADDIGDLAMEVFRVPTEGSVSALPQGMDGTWALPLLLRQQSALVQKRVKILGTRDIKPMSMRATDAATPDAEEFSDQVLRAMTTLSPTLKVTGAAAAGGEDGVERVSKKQKNKLKALKKKGL